MLHVKINKSNDFFLSFELQRNNDDDKWENSLSSPRWFRHHSEYEIMSKTNLIIKHTLQAFQDHIFWETLQSINASKCCKFSIVYLSTLDKRLTKYVRQRDLLHFSLLKNIFFKIMILHHRHHQNGIRNSVFIMLLL